MSMNRWMDKEAVVHIHSGTLLSYKRESIWVSPNEVDELIVQSEWSQSEREKQILYINTCAGHLERWYQWTYFQDSTGDADTDNSLMGTAREGESSTETYTVSYAVHVITYCCTVSQYHKTDSQWELAVRPRELNPGLCDNLEGWDGVGDGREVQRRGEICVSVADSCWCMAETSTIWQTNHPPIKKKF